MRGTLIYDKFSPSHYHHDVFHLRGFFCVFQYLQLFIVRGASKHGHNNIQQSKGLPTSSSSSHYKMECKNLQDVVTILLGFHKPPNWRCMCCLMSRGWLEYKTSCIIVWGSWKSTNICERVLKTFGFQNFSLQSYIVFSVIWYFMSLWVTFLIMTLLMNKFTNDVIPTSF